MISSAILAPTPLPGEGKAGDGPAAAPARQAPTGSSPPRGAEPRSGRRAGIGTALPEPGHVNTDPSDRRGSDDLLTPLGESIGSALQHVLLHGVFFCIHDPVLGYACIGVARLLADPVVLLGER